MPKNTLLRQHTVGDAAGGHEQLRVRVTVVGAVRNSRGGTKTASAAAVQVGACVEMVLIILQGCIKEQVVDAPVLQIQEGVAEQIVDFTVPSIKEVMVEVSVSGAHPRAHRGADRGLLWRVRYFSSFWTSASRSALNPSIPKKCRRRKRQNCKPGRDSGEELLEAAMRV